jgi:hypothetical protein
MQALEEFARAHAALRFESFAPTPTLAAAEAASDLDQFQPQLRLGAAALSEECGAMELPGFVG